MKSSFARPTPAGATLIAFGIARAVWSRFPGYFVRAGTTGARPLRRPGHAGPWATRFAASMAPWPDMPNPSDYYSEGLFIGGACSCCGTWVRVKPAFFQGKLYGQRCAGIVKNAYTQLRLDRKYPNSQYALRLASLEERQPKKVAYARTLLE